MDLQSRRWHQLAAISLFAVFAACESTTPSADPIDTATQRDPQSVRLRAAVALQNSPTQPAEPPPSPPPDAEPTGPRDLSTRRRPRRPAVRPHGDRSCRTGASSSLGAARSAMTSTATRRASWIASRSSTRQRKRGPAGPPLPQPSTGHLALTLRDGRILVGGGHRLARRRTLCPTPAATLESTTADSNRWSRFRRRQSRSGGTPATVLPRGDVLVFGWRWRATPQDARVYRLDPVSGAVVIACRAPLRAAAGIARSCLQDGSVLLAGAHLRDVPRCRRDPHARSSTSLATRRWTNVGPMAIPAFAPGIERLPNGQRPRRLGVSAHSCSTRLRGPGPRRDRPRNEEIARPLGRLRRRAGSDRRRRTRLAARHLAELYDPATGSWSAAGRLPTSSASIRRRPLPMVESSSPVGTTTCHYGHHCPAPPPSRTRTCLDPATIRLNVGAAGSARLPFRRCQAPPWSAIRGSRGSPPTEIRARFIEYFAERGHTMVPELQPRARGRQHPAVRQLRHGPVQGRADRRGEAQLHARRQLPALPAGRRQAQRLRGGRAVDAPPHVLRDARQLELRRLLQARGDPLGLGLPDEGPRHPRRAPRRDRVHDRRLRARRLEGRDRPAAGAARPLGRLPERRREELVADGRHRAVRAVLGDPLRSRAAVQRGRRLRPGPLGELPALARDLEPRVHGVRAAPRSIADAAARAGHRHGHGPRAPRERRPAGPARTTTRTCSPRSTSGCASCSGTTRTRSRPSASATRSSPTTPARRRSCSPTACCPRTRGAATSAAGSSGARSGTAGCSGGRSRSSPRRRRSSSRRWPTSTRTCARTRPRSSAAITREEVAFGAHARGRHDPPRGGAHPADLGRSRGRAQGRGPAGRCAGPRRRGRVQAPRHVRLPDRPDGRAGGRVRRRGRPRWVRRGARRAARAQPLRQEGRQGPPGRRGRAVPVDPRRAPATPSSSATRRRAPKRGSSRSCATGIEYQELEAKGEAELRVEAGAAAELVLDTTPFYAEGGGQIGDRGVLRARRGRRVRGRGHAARGGHADRRTDRPSRHAARAGRRWRHGVGRGRPGPARAHDAQPHGHAPAPSGAAERRRRAREAGRLPRRAGVPALRLPVRPRPDRRREAGDRGRGPAASCARTGRSRSSSCRWPTRSSVAPTRSSTRSTARPFGRSASRTTASSCAAARTAAPAARSAAS